MTTLPRPAPELRAARNPLIRTLSLATGLVLLAGCASQSMTAGDDTTPATIPESSLGVPLMGELTTASPMNFNDGTRYSQHRLCADSDGSLARYWFEAPYDARLSLFDDQGRLIALAEQPYRGEPAPILLGSESGSCRLLVVSGDDRRAYGPYRLDVLPAPEAIGDRLVLGQSLRGRLEGGQTQASYPFRVDEPIELSLVMRDASRSLGVSIRGEDVLHPAQRCGESETRLTTYLMPGDYHLDLEGGERADMAESPVECSQALMDQGRFFHLTTQVDVLPEGMRNGGPVNDGDVITGVRREQDNEYRLVIEQPSDVTLDLSSDDFDTIVALKGNGVDLENDDGDTDTDSRLNAFLLPGEYRVLVQSYEDYGDEPGGEYQLSATIQSFDGEVRNEGEVTPGEEIMGMLSSDVNRYRLTVSEASEFSIAVDSDNFDAYVELDGPGVSQSDDDSGGDYNALLNTVLQPGTYDIAVSSYSGTGLYTLNVTQNPLEGRLMNSGTLQPGDRIYGTMTDGEPLIYELDVPRSGQVQISTRSSAVDTVIHLSGQGKLLSDDDGGDGTNSLLSTSLEAGSYRLEVTGYDSGSSGVIVIEVTGPEADDSV